MSAAGIPCTHVEDFCFSLAQLLHNSANVGFRNLDHQVLHRLHQLAGFLVLLQNNGWRRYLEFKLFSAHIFNEDGQVQLTTTGHLKGIGGIGFLHTHCQVGFYFLKQTLTKVSGSNELALTTGERAVIYHKHHRYGWLVDLYKWQCLYAILCANGFTDVQVGNAGYRNDFANAGRLYFYLLQALVNVNLADFTVSGFAVTTANHNLHIWLDLATLPIRPTKRS